MSNPPSVTLDQMIEEIRRECEARRVVFSRLVAIGRMNRRQADRRIDVMDAILKYLEDKKVKH